VCKKQRIKTRKSSALLAAGTGIAVCLTGGTAAHAVNGLVSISNGGNSAFYNSSFNLFGSKVLVAITAFVPMELLLLAGSAGVAAYTGTPTSSTIRILPAGVSITSGLFFTGGGFIHDATDKYYGMRFNDSGLKYGWVHVVSATTPSGDTTVLDTWSYNGSGGAIKTLSDSVTTSRLALSDGKEKLYWSNDNESGVARYEVRTKDDAGNWTATDSDVPGSGSYSTKVANGAMCRLVIEMTDGSAKEVDF